MAKPTLADVYRVFKDLTGLDWYPEPSMFMNNDFWKRAVELVDNIIAAQAKSLGKAHCVAQDDTESELAPQAENLFFSFTEWVA